ncbi:MAG: hydantoinase/oxoprolinase family protein [Boseongicola sp. SB0677_bin_26]|nr:hydantoinase/oxoprolinase family protein [Boseongicola sp. SB0665_bin_10]MYG27675.1 hydantoinase/oxoprolinase family protein [Boseongicola sp. SB0677_bin_26]
MPSPPALRLAIDIGGTFTDTVLVDGGGRILATAKTPTTPPEPALGALEGARHALIAASAAWDEIGGFIHGTTLATNALIERRGARVGTITTEGFRDILEIAYERRYSQYAINLEKPDLIVPRTRAFTVGGRMNARGEELVPFDEDAVAALAGRLEAEGIEAVAICLLHAYANPSHELRLREMLRMALPEPVISVSHEVSPEAREFDRLCTTVANAYIQPLMSRYLADFETRFRSAGLACPILMMTASGGMTTLETAARLPVRLVESGPAGGAILAARLARETGEGKVVSFDMGGTTAKLCLIDDGQPRTARKFEIARAERFVKGSGMPVRIPVIEMIEIGAGGGSIANVDRLGRVRVGPQSAGANPGPAAFGNGGTQPTVTDADIVQGLIAPDGFAGSSISLNPGAAMAVLKCKVGDALGLDLDRAALAVTEIVDENMAGAGRMHAADSGRILDDRTMIAIGGNGPLHATRLARRTRVRTVVIPKNPGVGSAVGFLHAPVSFEIVRSRYTTLESLDVDAINGFFGDMANEARTVVRAGAPDGPLTERRVAFMRYHGQGHEIEVAVPARDLEPTDAHGLRSAFEAGYSRQFSRTVPDMKIEILNWAFRLASEVPDIDPAHAAGTPSAASPSGFRMILCDVSGEWREAAVYKRADLHGGARLSGPALITEPQTTTLVSADFDARVDGAGNIWMTRQDGALP